MHNNVFQKTLKIKGKKAFINFLKMYDKPFKLDPSFESKFVNKNTKEYKKVVNLLRM